MKRFFCLLLSLALIGSLTACGKRSAKIVKPANFYYCSETITYQDNNNIFVPEVRETDGFSDLTALMNNYVKGPESADLVSPFPAMLEVVSIKEVGSTLDITFTRHLAHLTGAELTLACVCAAKTLFELKGADAVIISAEGVLLDGKDTMLITPDRLSFIDTQPPETEP